jgi:hypothetical protein
MNAFLVTVIIGLRSNKNMREVITLELINNTYITKRMLA